ncbi:MAG: hypothetical protein JWM32_599 [Verrucomicrobia bacterium]|nr:hypothetical protein [Verrucomicrobiota bacterium]MDB6113748.1 hypothetical protein [Lacunisphaera sp.]
MWRMKLSGLLVLCGFLLAGCSTLTTHRDPSIADVKRVYVEHLLTDNHRIDQFMAEELRRLGYDASYGPLTMMPDKVDAVISYRERSAWDFKSYVIELNLEVKANFNGKILGTGRYYQPSMRTKSPEDVVHAVLAPIFPRRS